MSPDGKRKEATLLGWERGGRCLGGHTMAIGAAMAVVGRRHTLKKLAKPKGVDYRRDRGLRNTGV
jgi:hypothetical protein